MLIIRVNCFCFGKLLIVLHIIYLNFYGQAVVRLTTLCEMLAFGRFDINKYLC